MKIMRFVIAPIAEICTSPDNGASLDTEALFGEQVAVGLTKGGFVHVRLATDGYQGWMLEHCLGNLPPRTHQIIAPHSFVTRASDVKSQGVCHLSLGSQIDVVAKKNGFVKISLANGYGWVPQCHIIPLTKVYDDWVAIAESLIGSPYRWGGRTSIGLDCSALVQLAMAAGGHKVPRDSGPQHKIGKPIKTTERLLRGDLVFWEGHVGIMLDEDRMLHSNAYHMAVEIELLHKAKIRIAKIAGPITGYRRA